LKEKEIFDHTYFASPDLYECKIDSTLLHLLVIKLYECKITRDIL